MLFSHGVFPEEVGSEVNFTMRVSFNKEVGDKMYILHRSLV